MAVGAAGGTNIGSASAEQQFHGAAVQDITGLKAVTADQRSDKQLRFVEDQLNDYHFDAQSAAGESLPDIVAPDAGIGRWLRVTPGGGVPASHAASHSDGGTDEITVEDLGTVSVVTTDALMPDGAGGLAFGSPVAAAHAASHAAATGGDALSTGAAGAIAIGDAAAIGTAETFARSDHKHSLAAPAAPANVTKAAAAAGAAVEAARADHKHDVSTAVTGATAIGDAAAEGVATSLARSDHQHSSAAPGAPANVTKAAAAAGASTAPARADHKHDVDTAVAGATAIGDAATEGAATSLARSDHQHSLAAPAAPANVFKQSASAGTAVEPARADHKHDVSTDVPVTIGTANAPGSAGALPRADHVHDHGAQTTGTHHAAAVAAGASGFMTGADKTKLDDLNSQAVNTVSTTDATVTTIATIPITDDSVNLIDVRCVARRTDVDEAAGYWRRAVIFRRAAGVATFLGAQDADLEREDDNQWDFNIAVSGNNALLQVTGRIGRSIDWKSFHEAREIT